MAYVGLNTTPCCTPCSGIETVQVPGPAGPTGADGADGLDGVNAYSFVSTQFLMPETIGNPGNSASIAVSNSSWMGIGQMLYIENAGYLKVLAIPSTNTVTVQNMENLTTGTYADNVAPSSVVPVSSKISPGGVQGPAGAAGTNIFTADDGKNYELQLVTQDGVITAQFVEVI